MHVVEQITDYIANQQEPKSSDMKALHQLMLEVSPTCKLWFFDGTNSEDKIVANPTIGYGFHTIKYANGKSLEWFRIGMSANKTGISIYILGIKDKNYLSTTYGDTIGKASVSGYCIKFRSLKNIDINTLEAAIRYGFDLDI